MCLDVQRAAQREPAAVDALMAELALARGGDRRLDRHTEGLAATLAGDTDEADARRQAAAIAVALAGALLVRHAPRVIADAYCGSRIGDGSTGTLGMLPSTLDFGAIIERALPG
jgi:putative acyl-CoA dehydrogenase